jgi:hypothetical protein
MKQVRSVLIVRCALIKSNVGQYETTLTSYTSLWTVKHTAFDSKYAINDMGFFDRSLAKQFEVKHSIRVCLRGDT